jgi:hypothetical protein
MSLATQIAALATRVGQEIKTVRSEMSSVRPGFGDVDGGDASTYYGWQNFGIDNGDASTQIPDGTYIDGGNA